MANTRIDDFNEEKDGYNPVQINNIKIIEYYQTVIQYLIRIIEGRK